MLDPIILSTFWDVMWVSFILFFILIPLVMLWAFALLDLFFVRHDIRFSKVAWLVFIVFLPIIGPLIYLLVRPQATDAPPPQEPTGGTGTAA